ncbi:MAG: hypothetical protein HZB70_03775 [Candidatus Berkelbacteria bacterium]|nr:MAG: hypothetical protein HZB70_03775 [Candidatus Berkelbacteria bacterium]QQG51582.1 MAG: hypothetical protein HY845_03415 [Candidatus Berkelbacteria bacterium]
MEGSIKRRRGFTLIEILIDALVITIVFGALAGSLIFVIKSVNSGKLRTAAATLANEQVEYLRNLPYDSLSTQNGTILPQGNIPDQQTLTRSGNSFDLKTTIIFIDDVFDGCAIPFDVNLYQCTDGGTSATFDVVPVDYKRLTVEAMKVGDPTTKTTLSSNIAAKAAETPSNTGMLLVKVINALGQPVEGATVTVTNDVTLVDLQGLTNAQGYVFVANLPPDNQNGYHIVATKDGFSTDFTTDRTAQNPNQLQPDVDINVQQVTVQTLAIDLLATATLNVVNELGAPLSGVEVTATSNKLLYTNPDTPKNVYVQSSNGTGVAVFANIEWDSYSFTVASSYHVISTSPYQKVAINPGINTNVTLALTTDPNWPRIDSVSPTSGVAGDTVVVAIEGDNYGGNATVILRQAGQADIVPTVIDVNPNQKSLNATFNLTGAASGAWDIVLTSNNQIVTQQGGFTIS